MALSRLLMMLWPHRRKSAGVKVTPAVYALIRRGDRARECNDWAAAVDAYRKALTADPSLGHIAVQLGHAIKETGDLAGAEAMYRRATLLRPDHFEAFYFLGQICSMRRHRRDAAEAYFDALIRARDDLTIAQYLGEQLMKSRGGHRGSVARMLVARIEAIPPARRLGQLAILADLLLSPPEIVNSHPAGTAAVINFDVSDLMSYFLSARLPSGIQRVQMEVVASAIRLGIDLRICCFIEERDGWLEIGKGQFRALVELSVQGGDVNDTLWQNELLKLRLGIALSEDMVLSPGSALVNLGTSWWLQNYFLNVRYAQDRFGIRYIPLIHDLIPIRAPHHCVRKLTQDFISWLIGVFDHADHYLANSMATKRDLIDVAGDLDHSLREESVSVVPLDAGFQRFPAASKNLPVSSRPFMLFVSTIESRKGHATAFAALKRLIARFGEQDSPYLVCVGKNGWLNAHVFEHYEKDPVLRDNVKILSSLSDRELDRLYRDCLFTIYPSEYEGWGLPVTESLCYGKVPIVSDASSLPEAGGSFAVYVPVGSAEALGEAMRRLTFDQVFREVHEQRIRDEFRPRGWDQITRQIVAEIGAMAPAGPDDRPRSRTRPALGRYYSLGRSLHDRIWPGLGSGEVFRSGLGWYPPEPWGCRIRRHSGELRLTFETTDVVRIFLHLRGADAWNCRWEIRAESGKMISGEIAAGEAEWRWIDVTPQSEESILLSVSSEPSADGLLGEEEVPGESIGILAFYACLTADTVAQSALLEADAVGDYSAIDAFAASSAPIR